jgi:hypothetical protein
MACTEIGCISGVWFDLSQLAAASAGPMDVHACVDATCVDVSAMAPDPVLVQTTEAGPRTAVLTITVRDGGRLLSKGRATVELRKASPNGERCGPVCYSAQVSATPRGLTQSLPLG